MLSLHNASSNDTRRSNQSKQSIACARLARKPRIHVCHPRAHASLLPAYLNLTCIYNYSNMYRISVKHYNAALIESDQCFFYSHNKEKVYMFYFSRYNDGLACTVKMTSAFQYGSTTHFRARMFCLTCNVYVIQCRVTLPHSVQRP